MSAKKHSSPARRPNRSKNRLRRQCLDCSSSDPTPRSLPLRWLLHPLRWNLPPVSRLGSVKRAHNGISQRGFSGSIACNKMMRGRCLPLIAWAMCCQTCDSLWETDHNLAGHLSSNRKACALGRWSSESSSRHGVRASLEALQSATICFLLILPTLSWQRRSLHSWL